MGRAASAFGALALVLALLLSGARGVDGPRSRQVPA